MRTREFESKICLTNSGNLSFFFLGTGTAFSKKNFQTNLVVIKGQDHLLIDCGTLCSYVMEIKYNTSISEIKNVLITHPHADHVGGLEELGLIGRYVIKQKINLIINDEFKEKLWEETLKGGMQYSEYGKMCFEDYFIQKNPIVAIRKPFEILQTNIGSIDIKMFRTRHVTTKRNSLKDSQYSQGVIIDNRILYTCDTQFNPKQLLFLCETFTIETIIHDCDVNGYSEGVHATYEQLKTLPKKIKEKMYLCHYDISKRDVDPCKDGFAGFIESAKYYDFN